MTAQQIQCIIALAEEGSFSGAARKLFVTQPSISQLVKNMETQIGSPLFDRSSTPIKLTLIGEAYYDAAKKTEAINRELHNRVSEINGLEMGTLRIGTSPFRASCMLPRSIAFFKQRYPGIHINIVSDNINNLKEQLIDGAIDICIENNMFQDQLFTTEFLSTENYYLAVAKESSWNKGKEDIALTENDILSDSERLYADNAVTSAQLKQLSYVMLDAKSEYSDKTVDILNRLSIQPEDEPLMAANLETKFHWINSNLGAGFVPDTLIRFGNFTDHPLYYKINLPKRSIGLCQDQIVVAYCKNHFLSRAAKEYILRLKELIGIGTWRVG